MTIKKELNKNIIIKYIVIECGITSAFPIDRNH